MFHRAFIGEANLSDRLERVPGVLAVVKRVELVGNNHTSASQHGNTAMLQL